MLDYDKIYDANNDLKNKIQGPPKGVERGGRHEGTSWEGEIFLFQKQ